MRAFIFGSFNPVTNAHVRMGVMARDELGLDCRQVTYVPAADHYIQKWKQYGDKDILLDHIRLALLHGAVSPYGFLVNTAEMDGVTTGRTYDTLCYFGLQDATLCLGMDNIAQLPKWYRWEQLLKDVKLLIFERDGEHAGHAEMEVLERSCGFRIVHLDIPDGISSTEARRCYKEHDMEGLKRIVPETVYEYFKRKEQ